MPATLSPKLQPFIADTQKLATKFNMSVEELERCRQNLRAGAQRRVTEQATRRELAWQLAHQATDLLKQQFQVERVVVFGSLLYPERFTPWSDVDLAAWGLTSKNWLKAIMEVHHLSDKIELNLVDVGCCRPELLASIEREGKLL